MSIDAATIANMELPDENQELSVQEEYQLWRKNCRYMYEFVSETALTWPSLTVQWLPENTINEADGALEARLLLGTHTSGEDTNYLKVANTQLPLPGTPKDKKKVNSRIRVSKKLQNAHEVNRARYQPQNPSVVATINGQGEVDIYSLASDEKTSFLHLTPHTANGYGLAWRPLVEGHLLSASDDKSVVLSDIPSKKTVFSITSHQDIVNDAKWHHFDSNVFGSVSDDGYTYLFDVRTHEKPVSGFYSSEAEGVNSLSFSPFSQHLLAVGNSNSNIALLDTRKMTSAKNNTHGLLHTMMGHLDSITALEFSPHRDGILASGSQDRRLILWDLFKVGEEQAQEDAEDGCPELFMMHAGHTGGVTDLSWCPYRDWTVASVADDNIVHLWEVSSGLLTEGKGGSEEEKVVLE